MKYFAGLRVFDANAEPIRVDEYDRPDLLPEERPHATVLMQLQNEKGETVFRHSRSLQDWDWLRNMAMIDGKIVEVPGPGSVRSQRLDVGPDGGWGTSFEPRFSGRYTLVVVVEPANTGSQRLLLHPVMEAYTASP